MTIIDVLPWFNLLNLLLAPILVYLVKMEHRLTVVEEFERRLALLEARVFEVPVHLHHRTGD